MAVPGSVTRPARGGKMAVVSASDIVRPFTSEPYALFGDRIPALRSFYLAYDVGDATPDDHEILTMGVMVGGSALDLSPNVNFQPANIPDGRLEIQLQDAHPNDDESVFYKVSHSTLAIPGARRYQIRQVGNVREATRKLPAHIFGEGLPDPAFGKPIVALVGFRMFFGLSGDHELDRIGIWFRDDELHVVMQDQDARPTEDYSFLVDFVVIPHAPGTDVSRGVERGTARGGARIPLPIPARAHVFLTGWEFDFSNGDHEIREVGVDRQGDDYVVFFADSNADDPFDWRIEWAHIGPQVFV
jgi:hypothetical protein